ncbi:MAG: hypothetical protein QOF57_983 [Frankiaceae bacterium]|jgi:hypothetical protein|nr:hypothetical protein [Frankiaceae bacterium]
MDPSALAKTQSQVATTAQLVAAGVSRGRIAAQLRARRWQRHGRVIVLHNGPLTETQRQWIAVLRCPQPAALAGLTAARMAGVRLHAGDDTIHLLVNAHARVPKRPGVRVHYSNRVDVLRPRAQAPRVTTERAVIQAALWEHSPAVAAGYFIAAFQQRKVRHSVVAAELALVGDARHVAMLTRLLPEILNGAGSLAEVEFVKLARLAGLPAPLRQSKRVDADGRTRHLDVDFGAFSVEIDGPVHWDAASYTIGLARQNALVRRGERLLRFSTTSIWSEPESVVAELRSAWSQFGGHATRGAPHKSAS